MVTIGHAAIASPGFAKPEPGEHVNKLLWDLNESNADGWYARVRRDSKSLLSSIANFLTADWAEHDDRAENFQASLTTCECLEKLG